MAKTRTHRTRAAEVWQIYDSEKAAARLADPDDPQTEWLSDYQPQTIADAVWASGVGDLVRTQMARIEGPGPAAFEKYTRVLAGLAAFCQTKHLELEIEEVLTPQVVDWYLAEGIPEAQSSSKGTYASILRLLGPALTSKAPWEPAPSRHAGKSLPDPYTSDEITRILRSLPHQANAERTRSGKAIVALGLGAGLDGRWNAKIRGTDIEVRPNGLVVVRVPDPVARTVVARRAFEETLTELSKVAGKALLVGGESAGNNRSSRLASAIEIELGRLRLNASRLRSTWLLAHLEAGTPIPALLEAAGLKSLTALDDLICHLPDPTPDLAQSALRKA